MCTSQNTSNFFPQGVKVVLAAFYSVTDLTNETKREKWLNNLVMKAVVNHADGVNIDIEGPVSKGSKEMFLLSELTSDVYREFKEKLPGSQVI